MFITLRQRKGTYHGPDEASVPQYFSCSFTYDIKRKPSPIYALQIQYMLLKYSMYVLI